MLRNFEFFPSFLHRSYNANNTMHHSKVYLPEMFPESLKGCV